MRYEGLFIKKKSGNSLRLFSTEVKRNFVIDMEDEFIGYSKKKGGKLKKFPLHGLVQVAIYVDEFIEMKKSKYWKYPFYLKMIDRFFILIAKTPEQRNYFLKPLNDYLIDNADEAGAIQGTFIDRDTIPFRMDTVTKNDVVIAGGGDREWKDDGEIDFSDASDESVKAPSPRESVTMGSNKMGEDKNVVDEEDKKLIETDENPEKVN